MPPLPPAAGAPPPAAGAAGPAGEQACRSDAPAAPIASNPVRITNVRRSNRPAPTRSAILRNPLSCLDGALLADPVRVAQAAFVQLAVGIARQRIHEVDALGQLVTRHPPPQELEKLRAHDLSALGAFVR